MLKKIAVNNFRSLEDFSMEIRPGLNALVGPNGAGKTSIIKWFEFLSLLGSFSLRESIGKIGGANHVFRRKGEKYSEMLNFSFTGTTQINSFSRRNSRNGSKIYIDYEYDGTISVVKNQIFFSRQTISVFISSNNKPSSKNIYIDWSYDILTDKIECKIETAAPKSFKKDSLEHFYFEKKFLEEVLNSHSMLESMIVPGQIFPIDYLFAIKTDISYRKAFNINPSQVRSAIDISSQPNVQFDGAGTVSTLYEIKSQALGERNRYKLTPLDRFRQKTTLPRLIDYFKLSDSNISDINIEIENFRNEFTLEVEYKNESSTYKVPIFLLSDGTAKWISLITAISTERKAIFIEEPENFLHPKLQESIVEIIRGEIDGGDGERFSLITTHSETLLNKLNPEEIIIVKMNDGRTCAERIPDPEEISKIIADCGFGLGYFYVTGGF
ncbi:AAA family ATPase [Rhizobium paknamense]|uniref:ATPase n=1 Tax=Rhizobium paknamense TaxID=1206817 RepID=A0ABU0ICY3_9HYPH|nr:AAA family ATPase [Rhizobium paknamense]MDQ0456106.1 putative ATPase [Rhizobium paknamense]